MMATLASYVAWTEFSGNGMHMHYATGMLLCGSQSALYKARTCSFTGDKTTAVAEYGTLIWRSTCLKPGCLLVPYLYAVLGLLQSHSTWTSPKEPVGLASSLAACACHHHFYQLPFWILGMAWWAHLYQQHHCSHLHNQVGHPCIDCTGCHALHHLLLPHEDRQKPQCAAWV